MPRIEKQRALLAFAALVAVLALPRASAAHGLRSAYVEITEIAPGRARVVIRGNMPVTGVGLTAAAPCEVAGGGDGDGGDPPGDAARGPRSTDLSCPGALAGAELTVTGLGPVASEAVMFVRFLDGRSTTACVTPGAPTWRIPGADPGMLGVAARYVRLGIEHIATGADHLLFLLALVLCLRTLRAVMLAETAFTLSHTLSFSASALGWIRVSASAAEACIAVSLVLVALDVGRSALPAARSSALPSAPAIRRAARLSAATAGAAGADRTAWKAAGLAFAFGLVHGLGFAGGLAEIGLPATAIPAALIGFAGGVEIGQVAFLAIAVTALALLSRAPKLRRAAVELGAYAVGGIGWFWLFQRITALS